MDSSSHAGLDGAKQASQSNATVGNPDRPRRMSQLTVMLGLFVTFAGIAMYGLQVPARPAVLAAIVPWLAVGFIVMWAGGILAGNSLSPPEPGTVPALRGQSALGLVATVAGGLSGTVVVRRLGVWATVSPGLPPEIVVAAVGAFLVWLGGFLMGRSMRRFTRRRRRARSGN
jgi:hypothetical protein